MAWWVYLSLPTSLRHGAFKDRHVAKVEADQLRKADVQVCVCVRPKRKAPLGGERRS